MVILSFTRLLGAGRARAVGIGFSTNAEDGDALIFLILFARIARASKWFSKRA
jgi:hypothetical protein